MTDQQKEPSFLWTRWAAFIALANMVWISHAQPAPPEYIFWAHVFVIACWALGSNGRMAIVDAVARWRK